MTFWLFASQWFGLCLSGDSGIMMTMTLLTDPYFSAFIVRPITMTNVEELTSVDQSFPSRWLVIIRLLHCVTLQEPLECLGSGNLTFQKIPLVVQALALPTASGNSALRLLLVLWHLSIPELVTTLGGGGWPSFPCISIP